MARERGAAVDAVWMTREDRRIGVSVGVTFGMVLGALAAVWLPLWLVLVVAVGVGVWDVWRYIR